MANEIVKMQTVPLKLPSGPAHAIMIAVNVERPEESASFASHVIERFKVQRLCSPPDTSVLVVSVIGPVDFTAFTEAWIVAAGTDKGLREFLSRMQTAECVHGTEAGDVIATASLLASGDTA